ncbi:hypothetical protein PsorP6_000172 [Peronosclerospora sorghi]|uniref:Uncharacterized protein n=1 Tax=Peronosclerospora sorghi TaxID=230839 RepID=A0ACC0WRK2_9STRA|nr:hypothetical protein PsorP6_000172 [Peronosclerospora sorghi]
MYYKPMIRTVDEKTEESPGEFLMEPEPTSDATATDDPWFVSASPEKGAMLYKEETARWLENHTTRSLSMKKEKLETS